VLEPSRGWWIYGGNKNPQHKFLLRTSFHIKKEVSLPHPVKQRISCHTPMAHKRTLMEEMSEGINLPTMLLDAAVVYRHLADKSG
jgi:hypothetical protein